MCKQLLSRPIDPAKLQPRPLKHVDILTLHLNELHQVFWSQLLIKVNQVPWHRHVAKPLIKLSLPFIAFFNSCMTHLLI